MKNIGYGLLLISLASATASVFAGEQRSDIKFDALPESVRDTVSHFIKPDNITKIERVTAGDHVKYEVTSDKTVANKNFLDVDMTVAADGGIMKISKEVPVFNIPFPLMQQVNRRYPGLKVDEVEVVQVRHFLLQGNTDGKPVNLQIFDDGTIRELTAEPKSPRQAAKPQPKQTPETPPEETAPPMPGHIESLPDDDFEYEIKPLLDNK